MGTQYPSGAPPPDAATPAQPGGSSGRLGHSPYCEGGDRGVEANWSTASVKGLR